MGTQVLEDELREIGTDCDRHCYLAKDSGFYHVGSGMTLRGRTWLGHVFLCSSCSKEHKSMWWLNGNHCLLPGTSRSLGDRSGLLASVTLGMHVTYKLSSDWAHRLTGLPEGA